MAQTIKLKRSAQSGASGIPSTSDLALGEVGINTYHGKMYIKKDDGTESIVEVGSTGSFLPLSGGTLTGNLNLGDNVKAQFGAGDDLEIFSNGSTALLKAGNATSDIRIESDNRIVIADRGFNEAFAVFNDDSDVKLYHDGSQKFATTSTGIDVTGFTNNDSVTTSAYAFKSQSNSTSASTHAWYRNPNGFIGGMGTNGSDLTFVHSSSANEKLRINATGIDVTGSVVADGLTVDGGTASPIINLSRSGTYSGITFSQTVTNVTGAGADLSTYSLNANTGYVWQTCDSGGTTAKALYIAPNKDISFYNDSAAQGLFWDSSASSLGIGTTSPSSFVESSRFVVGSGTSGINEMMFLYSGTNAFGAIGFADGTSGTSAYKGTIGYHHDTDEMFFSTNGGGEASRDLTISSSGNATFTGSVTAPTIKSTSYYEGTSYRIYNSTLSNYGRLTADSLGSVIMHTGVGESARLTPTGLGIGTSSPSYALDVSGAAGDVVRFTGDANNSMRAYLGSGYQIFQCVNSGTTNQFGYGGGSFYVQTSGAERIRIFSGGNTSIGSSTDLGYKLNVVGNALFRTDSAATTFGNHSSSIRIQNKNTTDNNYAGIVFDGSTNAAGAIQFQYTDQSGSYGDICFETRGSGGYAERLRIDSSGSSTFSGNITMQHDDALLFIKETDGTNIAAIGDLTGEGQGGAFYYNHGGTATIQLKSYEASTIGHGLNVGGSLDLSANTSFPTAGFTLHTNGFLYNKMGSNGFIFSAQNGTEAMRITGDGTQLTIPNGSLMVGATTAPSGKLHIKNGASGATYTPDGADQVILENNDSMIIDIRTPSGNSGGILFSDNDARGRGFVLYSHSNDTMYINTAGASALTLDSSQNATFSGAVTSTGLTLSTTYPKLQLNSTSGVPRNFSVGTNNETFTIRNETASSDSLTISNANIVNIPQSLMVGSTTAPSAPLHILGNSSLQTAVAKIVRQQASASNNTYTFELDSSAHVSNMTSGGAMAVDVNSGRAFTINGLGNVGIGLDNPSYKLETKDGDIATVKLTAATSGNAVNGMRFRVLNSANTAQSATLGMINGETVNSWGGVLTFSTKPANGTPNESVTERMRIDSSGNVLISTTDTAVGAGDTNTGISLQAAGRGFFSIASDYAGRFNRNTSDGDVVTFAKDGSNVGSIGTANGNAFILSNDVGLTFAGGNDAIFPTTSAGAYRDAAIDLGGSGQRFKDLYLSGGVIGGGAIQSYAGTEGAAAFRPNNDLNTGIFFPATDTFAVTTSGSEAYRVDSFGNLLVGKTTSTGTSIGAELRPTGIVTATVSSNSAIFLNRKSSDGSIATFQKDNTTKGNISVSAYGMGFGGGTRSSDFFIKTDGTASFASGVNVGIGTTPSKELDIQASSGWAELALRGAAGSSGSLEYYNASTKLADIYADTSADIIFRNGTNGVIESARLTSSNELLIGCTSAGDAGITLDGSPSSNSVPSMELVRDFSGTATMIRFTNISGSPYVGSISSTTSATAYNTSSDERLKDNIVDAPIASEDIDAIQVRSFDWKVDGEHQKYGMVAQELLEVAPDAVTKGDTPDDMMGVDYSKLVPMLIKEIQSLRQRVAQLEE